MAQTVCVLLSMSDRRRLKAIAADRNLPRKHVERVQIVLASADGRPVQQVATEIDVSRPMVWRWQQHFAEKGPDGLLRDKTRKQTAGPGRDSGACRGADLRRAAAWDHALDGSGHGQGCRHLIALGAAHLGCPPTSIRLPMRWCGRSTRNAKSRRLTALSPGCRSSLAAVVP